MSDTELDGTPEDVSVHGEAATESVDVYRGPGWRRSAIVVLPLLAGLFLVAALGARMLLAEIPEPDPIEQTVAVTCWDGASLPADECTVPSGRAGLRWVFPSFRPDELGCRNVLLERPEFKRPAMFACEGRVRQGKVTITYSQLNGVAQARSYLEKEYDSPPEEIDDARGRRLLWTEGARAGDGVYRLDMVYAEVPFGVEVRAGSAKARDQALKALVRFRPEEQISVRP